MGPADADGTGIGRTELFLGLLVVGPADADGIGRTELFLLSREWERFLFLDWDLGLSEP